jgi:EAL domain-containing protein (putative c-di-GMP-specific phosphodiesterase class I)
MLTFTKADIVQGMSNREFVLYYQPKVSLLTNRIVGAEALARWQRPDGSVMAPGTFFPAVERAGLMSRFTLALLPQLLEDIGSVLGTDLRISFNVSASDFDDDRLGELVLRAIAHDYLPPACLELEITETQALGADDIMLERIRTLVDSGVALSMDDFGIGYSNLDTLSRLPFTTIKLDQGIIGRMLVSRKSATIISSSIRLGHELGMEVIAEGVETLAQQDFLVEAGCKLMQGYLLSPALPLRDFRELRNQLGSGRIVPMGAVHMAIVDHVQWRRQMVSYAIQRASLPPQAPMRQADGHPEMCPTRCALGRWYFGEGSHLSGCPVYDAIDSPHRELHRIGDTIVERVRKGAGLAELESLLSTMRGVSTGMIRLLEDLEDMGLSNLYQDFRASH